MLNTFQKTTPSGKPVVNKQTKLPEFTKSINQRLHKVCKELGIETKWCDKTFKVIPQYTPEQRWNNIRTSVSVLT